MIYRLYAGDAEVFYEDGIFEINGLGSCIALAIFSVSRPRVGGMAHILLPEGRRRRGKPALTAESGVNFLVNGIRESGFNGKLAAKMAGGSDMFPGNFSGEMKIGLRNVHAVEKALRSRRIPLLARDVGGNHGRTVRFYLRDGKMVVKSIRGGVIEL